MPDIQGIQGNGGAGMIMQGPAICTVFQAVLKYPEARQKELKIKPFDLRSFNKVWGLDSWNEGDDLRDKSLSLNLRGVFRGLKMSRLIYLAITWKV